jgi:hypothetical protein
MARANTRKLTLRLTPVRGTIERFYAFVDGRKRIAADGTGTRSWSGQVGCDEVRVKLRVFGMGSARWALEIDLPGTMDDQRIELKLDRGYGELELRV